MNNKPLTKREKARLKRELKTTLLYLPLIILNCYLWAYMGAEAIYRYFYK